MSGRAGYVYVAEFADGLIKVGFTKKPSLRFYQIARQSGRICERHWISERLIDAYRLEQSAHRALGDARAQGEWYLCSYQQAVDVVESLQGAFERWSQAWQDAVDLDASKRVDALMGAVTGAQCKAATEAAVRKLVMPLRMKMIRDDVAADAINKLIQKGVSDPLSLFIVVLNDPRLQHISDSGLLAAGAAGEILERADHLAGGGALEKMLLYVQGEAERRAQAEPLLEIGCLDALLSPV